MLGLFVNALFSWANTFIAMFIMIYAYLFLTKTKKHRDRKPWDFLFLASFIFLLYQIFNLLVVSGVTMISAIDLTMVSNLMSFLFAGAVLLAFVSQHDLILKSQIILISKKDDKKEAEIDIEIGEK